MDTTVIYRVAFRKKKMLELLIGLALLSAVFFTIYRAWLKIHLVTDKPSETNFEIEKIQKTEKDYLPPERLSKEMLNTNYKKASFVPKHNSFTGEKLLHLDLKGAPPKVSYFMKLFPYVKRLGITGILIEYEDMFPYSDALDRADNAYSYSDIETILKIAEENSLTVIPLIQTFGHVEFLLKLEKFKNYREVPNYPQVLCPLHVNATTLVQAMIDEVLKVHHNVKHIHIGCDEVYYMGKCSRCLEAKEKNDWTDHDLLLNHIRMIGWYIKEKYPGIKPIIWADMLLTIRNTQIEKYKIHELVEIMVWHYTPEIQKYYSVRFFSSCAKLFKSIWIAGAFKGATGSDKIIPDVNYHLSNLEAWMKVYNFWQGHINFKGIALTGWQRYDHFGILCELLPVGIPSLTAELQYLNNFENDVDKIAIQKILRCNGPLVYSPRDYLDLSVSSCDFPGFPVYKEVIKFLALSNRLENLNPLKGDNGWFSAYHILTGFTSPAQVENFFRSFFFNTYLDDLEKATKRLSESLLEVYDEHTVNEWILTNVVPLRVRLECLRRTKNELKSQTVWPRRPLKIDLKPFLSDGKSVCSDKNLLCALIAK